MRSYPNILIEYMVILDCWKAIEDSGSKSAKYGDPITVLDTVYE
jgi:hypothetical protein